MGTIVTASLVVNLDGGASSSILTAEIDGYADGLNNGNTSFAAGDQVGYLLFQTDDVSLLDHLTTSGTIVYKGTRDIPIEEFVAFNNSREASPSKPIISGWQTPVWYGTDLGNISVQNQSSLLVTPPDPTNPPKYYVGVAKISYVTRAYQYQLATPSQLNGEAVFSILVFVAGKVN